MVAADKNVTYLSIQENTAILPLGPNAGLPKDIKWDILLCLLSTLFRSTFMRALQLGAVLPWANQTL